MYTVLLNEKCYQNNYHYCIKLLFKKYSLDLIINSYNF